MKTQLYHMKETAISRSYFSLHDVLKENLTWDDDDSALVAIDAAAMSALAM